MATLTALSRSAAADAVVDKIDQGSGAGKLKFYTSGNTLLATLTMSDPAFGNASSGVATANSITDDTSADTDGTASYFTCTDSDDTEIFRGTVGTSGAELNLNTVSFVTGVNVSVTSLTYTQPAS